MFVSDWRFSLRNWKLQMEGERTDENESVQMAAAQLPFVLLFVLGYSLIKHSKESDMCGAE